MSKVQEQRLTFQILSSPFSCACTNDIKTKVALFHVLLFNGCMSFQAKYTCICEKNAECITPYFIF